MLRGLRILRFAKQKVRVTINDGEQIVKMMGRSSRYLANRLHFLNLEHFLFSPAPRADISRHY